MEKGGENTEKVVDKTSPAGGRQRLLSRNVKIKASGVL